MNISKKTLFSICIFIIVVLLIVIFFAIFIIPGNPPGNWFFGSRGELQNVGNISVSNDTNLNNNIQNQTVILAPNQTATGNETNNNEITNNEAQDEPIETDYYFELPIKGSTGFASIAMNMVNEPNSSKSVKKLAAGDAFKILEEKQNWWKVQVNDKEGWVNTTYCMINLPDIIPSIIYDDTNSYSSLFRSSGYDISDVTGKKLYDVYMYNERLNKKEYIMPVIYAMAKKVMKAQTSAMDDGYSLKIYETYRPYETQRKVCTNLKDLLRRNRKVYDGIYSDGWSEDWFINQSISSHQRGIAMDVSLVKVKKCKVASVGKYRILSITDYDEETMPTPMHELSKASATFVSGVATYSKTAWKSATLAKTMTSGSKRLQKYCTDAGLTPLSSEWWHFNDLDSRNEIGNNYSTGNYKLKDCFSVVP